MQRSSCDEKIDRAGNEWYANMVEPIQETHCRMSLGVTRWQVPRRRIEEIYKFMETCSGTVSPGYRRMEQI